MSISSAFVFLQHHATKVWRWCSTRTTYCAAHAPVFFKFIFKPVSFILRLNNYLYKTTIKLLTCHQMLRAGEDGAAANKHTPQRSTQLNNCVGNNSQCGTVWIKGCRSFIWCFSRFRRLRSLPCQCIQSIIHFELRIVLNRTPKNWKNTTYLHTSAHICSPFGGGHSVQSVKF